MNTTGLVYMRARYYDPAIGRFISEDSAKDGGNWYAYAGENPVGMVDADGQKPVWVTGAALEVGFLFANAAATAAIFSASAAGYRAATHLATLSVAAFSVGFVGLPTSEGNQWLSYGAGSITGIAEATAALLTTVYGQSMKKLPAGIGAIAVTAAYVEGLTLIGAIEAIP